MHRSIFFAALASCCAAIAAQDDPVEALKRGQPAPVAALIDRITGCNHWAGEEPYDALRAREIKRALSELRCGHLQKDEAAVLKKYRDASSVKNAISAAKGVIQ